MGPAQLPQIVNRSRESISPRGWFQELYVLSISKGFMVLKQHSRVPVWSAQLCTSYIEAKHYQSALSYFQKELSLFIVRCPIGTATLSNGLSCPWTPHCALFCVWLRTVTRHSAQSYVWVSDRSSSLKFEGGGVFVSIFTRPLPLTHFLRNGACAGMPGCLDNPVSQELGFRIFVRKIRFCP